MKKIAFLSMHNIDGFFVYDDLLLAPLAAVGLEVESISWRAENVDWLSFDAVIIRSPWDYQDDVNGFLQCLERISQQTRLLNDLDIVRWNIDKTYLSDIQKAGVAIVPSIFEHAFDANTLLQAFAHFQTQELIIKPLVSANADDTYRIKQAEFLAKQASLQSIFSSKGHIIQPFVAEILREGEYSLFYFGNQFSHAIRKVPKKGDFRVQEEHGGQLHSMQPEPALLAAAEQAIKAIPGDTLYARLDFIRYQGRFLVMELELIEPSLYFNMDEDSPQKFVQALLRIL